MTTCLNSKPKTAEHLFADPEFCEAWYRMAERVHTLAKEQGFWDESERHPTHPIALAMSELGEALEAWRFDIQHDKNITQYTGFEVQLSDVLGILLDMTAGYKLNMPEALIDKMEFNRGRGHLHGKRY
jgi:hypothetical protein